MRSWILLLAGASTLALVTPRPASAREMHWKSLAVTARLDAQGVLHVRERHHLVMTGDWNGGERSFRIEPTQDLQLQAMRRIDPATGAVHEMEEGDLDGVDHYSMTPGNVLRWRSRRPSDPAFDHADLVYELDYTLYGSLQPYGDAYLLAHDFAFEQRPGEIELLVLDLAIDPAWDVDGGRERHLEAGPLPVSTAYIVRLGLRPTAAASVATLSPARQRLLLALLIVPVLLLLQLFVSEWIRGRFAPLDPERAARELDRELLAHPAEVVGAAWDGTVGPDEVGALIARLAAAEKIKTTVLKGGELQMTLLVDRSRFDGYERELVDGFFFGDRTTVNTSQVRKRYEKTGFDPVARIRPGVEKRAQALIGPPARRLPVWLPTLLALAGGAYAVLTGPGPLESRVIAMVVLVLPAVLIGGIGVGLAASWRSRIDRGLLATARFVPWIAILVGVAAEMVTGFRHIPALAALLGAKGGFAPERQLAAVLFALAMVNSIVNGARSRERMRGIVLRKRLASARRYFQDEFGKAEPALRDEWFPYVLALGLDGDSRRWFRSFGGAVSDRSSTTSWSRSADSSSGSSSSGGPTGWSGGGGAFGGAGATASWAAAAGALSAGVAAPSSSGSSSSGGGGGGGGGGSSSGGGGGGGW
jgi:uncharacterized membrane protein YgcG